jgi:hypothetical protein
MQVGCCVASRFKLRRVCDVRRVTGEEWGSVLGAVWSDRVTAWLAAGLRHHHIEQGRNIATM